MKKKNNVEINHLKIMILDIHDRNNKYSSRYGRVNFDNFNGKVPKVLH